MKEKIWEKNLYLDVINNLTDMLLIQSLKNEFCLDLPDTSINSYFYKMTLYLMYFLHSKSSCLNNFSLNQFISFMGSLKIKKVYILDVDKLWSRSNVTLIDTFGCKLLNISLLTLLLYSSETQAQRLYQSR